MEADKMSRLPLVEPEESHVAIQMRHAQVKRSSTNMATMPSALIERDIKEKLEKTIQSRPRKYEKKGT